MTPASSGDLKAIVTGLRKSALLAGLSDRQLKRLAHYAMVRTFPKGSVVVTRGEKGIGFYVVLDGHVEVRKAGTVLARLGPGDFFGELALFDKRPRSADVVTLEPTTVVVLSRWEFWGFAGDEPEILRTILQEMARRLEQTAKVPAP
jgi:CRP/FNR family transcriptional regulator, cyclic AMP receptor protein